MRHVIDCPCLDCAGRVEDAREARALVRGNGHAVRFDARGVPSFEPNGGRWVSAEAVPPDVDDRDPPQPF